MTIPGGYQHSSFGAGQAPFDPAAGQTIETLRNQLRAPQPVVPPRPLSAEERKEAEAAAKEAERTCRYCIGLHAAPNTVGCPRIASGKIDGDGRLVEFTYWPGTAWATGRVTFIEDAFESEGTGEEAGDAGH